MIWKLLINILPKTGMVTVKVPPVKPITFQNIVFKHDLVLSYYYVILFMNKDLKKTSQREP